jgi:hypothetical protein
MEVLTINQKFFSKKLSRTSLLVLLVMFTMSVCFINCCNAQTSYLGPAIINNDLVSSDVFTVFSPQEFCYNKSSVVLNFSLTGHSIGTIAYSLDDKAIQGIQTSYEAGGNDSEPFLNDSENSQVTVKGDLVFEDLSNGNHTLRLYLGHQIRHRFEVEAFTEVNFSVKAPTVLLIQKQDCYTSGDVSLELFVSEPTCLLYCLDNRVNYTISGNTTLTGLSSGYHNITVYAFNGAGSWCASNTINFEILGNTVDSASPSNTASISQQTADFPFLLVFVVFVILICCMFPIISYLEKVNEEKENSNKTGNV